MKYSNNEEIMLGDLVQWSNSPEEIGYVVCLIDEGKFIDGYDFSYLTKEGGGIMVLFNTMGLVQIMKDDHIMNIELVSHLNRK